LARVSGHGIAAETNGMITAHLIHGRAELLLRPDFETTSAAMLFSEVIASIAALAGLEWAKPAGLPYHL
jgi:hypothetical protein